MLDRNLVAVNADALGIARFSYRPDIDGLRAIAVLPVVFSHANIPGFSGGFVGVDIFFVISGYLITSLIYSEIQLQKFSLANFYLRRAKRIFPALIVVLASTAVASWFILLPDEFFKYGKSLLATAFFVSNFHFRMNVGYFDGEAIDKPLLHTWSLAIEEQFYIIFPLLLLALSFRVNLRLLMLLAFVFTLVGLVAAEITVRQSTETAFYLLPFRGWELLLGASIAFGIQSFRITKHTALMLSLLGVAAIATSVILLDQYSLFPGLNALLPCIGAALLILGGSNNSTIVQKLLVQKPIVFIGLISYSLYLWHWPIFSLSQYYLNRELLAGEAAFAIMVSVALAAITWKFVEWPVRHSSLGRTRPLRAIAYISLPLIALAMGGSVIRIGDGIPSRLPDKIAAIYVKGRQRPELRELCHGVEKALINNDSCNFGAGIRDGSFDMVIWGDSHADHFVPAFSEVARKWGWSGRQISESSCKPLWDISLWKTGRIISACEQFDDIMEKFLRRNQKLKLVVLASRWVSIDKTNSDISYANSRQVLIKHWNKTVARFVNAGIKVAIIGQIQESTGDPLNCMVRQLQRTAHYDSCDLPSGSSLKNLNLPNELLVSISKGSTSGMVRYVSITDYLCDERRCRIELNGQPLYANLNHLSNVGSRQLSGYFFSQLDDFVRRAPPQNVPMDRGQGMDAAKDDLKLDRLIIAK